MAGGTQTRSRASVDSQDPKKKMSFQVNVWIRKLCQGLAVKMVLGNELLMRQFSSDEIQLVQRTSKKPLYPLSSSFDCCMLPINRH